MDLDDTLMYAYDPLMPATAGVGPRPTGDPDAMRDLARRLQLEAARVRWYQSLDLTSWRSQRATEVRDLLQGYADSVRRSGDSLDGLANELDIEAEHVDQQQIDWASRKALADAEHSSIPRDKI